jgi:tetratricopeptide (TPR) repeat protein
MNKTVRGFLFIFIVLCNSCQTGKPIKRLSDDGLMYAMIYDYDNTPLSGVAVYLNGRKNVDSDILGRFILESVKKGEYQIRLVKKGYEEVEGTFQYEPMNVLYFKMINADQLISQAEAAIDANDYTAAENHLDRALALEPRRPDILFLKSITYYLQNRYADSSAILEELIKSESTDPSISLLLEKIRKEQSEDSLE